MALCSEILLGHKNSKKDPLNRILGRLRQPSPAGTMVELIPHSHELPFEMASVDLPLRLDFSSASAQAIKRDLAQGGMQRRLIKQIQFMATEEQAKTHAGRSGNESLRKGFERFVTTSTSMGLGLLLS